MKCIIIDDEPLALDLIKSYVDKTPMLQLEATFTNPFKALSFLIDNEVDLLFLDINMPELSGLQLLKSLSKKPLVIFTTAYPEFGAESYEYDAVDYLLKPINYVRFLKSVTKALDVFKSKSPENLSTSTLTTSEPAKEHHILIKSSTKLHKINLDEILYIEGAGNYWSFQLKDKKILSLFTYNEIVGLVPQDEFIRIHKSYIVPKSKISVIEKHQVTINGKTLPIGLTFREHFSKFIHQ
ncbi:LytR/AlgR family response regulator transcription factor [Flavobacterium sedimenticola]|uniref:LytTR family DNA-binding domain-containing protein n=1 Tax=Flavobacterium sedimenticola TaxID=3043286 RepID=A0ABT6XST5_9FLAO|nr:LytTR family DNA-binding domain-containing protein [Flavobacterium sedimenticola]MDI9258158.1 LytTR family DNA-binding domain-containing protein [Flavobacterium sedimenticola]